MLDRLKRKIIHNPLTGRAYLSMRYGWPYQSIHPYLDIPGWLSIPEAVALFRVGAFEMPAQYTNVVEIGSWVGKSSVVLGKALQKRGTGTLYCIDPFDTSGDEESHQAYQTAQKNFKITPLETFQKNIHHFHLEDQIETLQGFSHDFSKEWDKPIGFLFIDGNHDYDAVLRDFLEWSPHLVPGGIIAFHDVYFDENGKPTGRFPGPAQVIAKHIQPEGGWQKPRQIDTLFLAQKAFN